METRAFWDDENALLVVWTVWLMNFLGYNLHKPCFGIMYSKKKKTIILSSYNKLLTFHDIFSSLEHACRDNMLQLTSIQNAPQIYRVCVCVSLTGATLGNSPTRSKTSWISTS